MICVLGILDTYKGRKIAESMREWIAPIYELHEVLHDGTQYELPALKDAQRLSIDRNEPVLYLHTRGAVNIYPTTAPTHLMWKDVFGDTGRGSIVRRIANDATFCGLAVVYAPYIDADFTTRYNGFIATPEAWKMIDLQPTTERHDYEHLWRGTKAIAYGIFVQGKANVIRGIRKHLMTNYG